jgi:RND superfamily putative drug exporter
MRRVFTFPAGRITKFVVVAVGIVLAGYAGSFAGKFEESQNNEQSSFLPEATDSARAVVLSQQFPSGENVPAVIVFRRDSGLTDTDRQFVTTATSKIRRALPEVASSPAPPSFSSDGAAALVVVPMVVNGDDDALVAAVDSFKENLTGHPGGLAVKVGGPAGFASDANEVFGNINGTLFVGALILVVVLLILIYRSPIFWVLPVVSVLVAEAIVQGLGYGLIKAGVNVNGQSAGILRVLVFGVGTDYALLLVSRYREELHHFEDRHTAMKVALRQAGPTILASVGTVIAGLLCLTLAEVNGTAGLGSIGALGVAVAALAMLTFLPALLVICGRRVFWPFIPRFDGTTESTLATRGIFRRTGEWIARGPRRIWVGATVALVGMCLGLAALSFDLTSANSFRGDFDAVEAQGLISRSFPGGATVPTDIVVLDPARVEEVRTVVTTTEGVASIGSVETGPPGARFDATLTPDPYTQEAYDVVPRLRDRLADAVGDGTTLVGGGTAVERDFREAAGRDTVVLPPIVLLVVFLILAILLRSIVAPVLLIATVVLSYLAALGVTVLVSEWIFDFPGFDPSFPLFAFIFLVALGVDYNIFLMARVREESLKHGTREGTLRGLAATGAVITSAGIVLAGTFAILGVLPLVFLTQLGFAVAFGVLLDTILVRSVLVPALTIDLDRRTWWPSRLSRSNAPV